MKLICASMSKTGTTSLTGAMKILGYSGMDYSDHFHYLYEDWMKAFEGKAMVEDYRRMYKNVDFVCDLPVYIFWEELLEAFPEAKVVLLTRDEDAWFESLRLQIKILQSTKLFWIPQYITPTGRKLKKYNEIAARMSIGDKPLKIRNWEANKDLTIRGYRRHNASVIQRCPKEKLLIYNCSEGWGPLCKFLSVARPGLKFPHKNIKGSMTEEVVTTHPLFAQLEKEVKIVLSILIIAFCVFIYFIMSYVK